MNRFLITTKQGRASLAAAITGILVGAAMVASKSISADVSPPTLALLRYLIGLAVLIIPLSIHKWVRYPIRDLLAIAILGIFQFAILMLLLNYALAKLSATTCSLIFSTMPLWTIFIALIFRLDNFSARKIVGIAFAITGIVWLISISITPNVSIKDESLDGYFAVLTATLLGAITTVIYKPYLIRYPALQTCSFAMGASTIFLILFCFITSQPIIPNISLDKWLNVVFIGLCSGVGFYCWLWALSIIEISRVVAFQVLGPLTAAFYELIITRQLPSFGLLISMFMIGTGLYLAIYQLSGAKLIKSTEDHLTYKGTKQDFKQK